MSLLSKRTLSLVLVVVFVSLSISFSVKAENDVNNEIENGSFEMGNLSSWTVFEGTAFSDQNISNASTWWAEEITYNKVGEYHLDGWSGVGESATGKLRSYTLK